MSIIAFDETIVKWSNRKKINMEVSRRMKEAGFIKRAMLMEACGDTLSFNKCPDCGKSALTSANFCRDRLCPTCAWRLSLRRYAEMCCTMGMLSDSIKPEGAAFLTLTVKNCYPDELRETLDKMAKAWNRMLARRKIKPLFDGWARSVEVTYNRKTATFHPHYHVILILSDKGYAMEEGRMRELLSDAWYASLQTDYRPITDYTVIDHLGDGLALADDEELHKAILETYKYTVKSDDVLDMPLGAFRSFVNGLAGVRVSSFGGCIKEARKRLGYGDEDMEEADAGADTPCPDCGAEMRQVILKWSFEDKKYNQVMVTAALNIREKKRAEEA